MSTTSGARRIAALILTTALSLPTAAGLAGAAPAPTELSSAGVYVVTLAEPPRDGAVERMRRAQDELLRGIGGPPMLYRYTSALNGFAAELTREQVKQLRVDPDVALVERSTLQRPDSVDSPGFLGAEEAWRATGGPEGAGRGTVVGVVDSGIWPENPSFAAIPDASPAGPRGFDGECDTGEQWDAADCNSKIVAARYFVEAFGEQNLAASESVSPRDVTGHGSHVAAIAAGNPGVEVEVAGQRFGEAAGMAPGARIASYKACWTAPDPDRDGCETADALAALDQAVSDGVDVISYAISGPSGTVSDSVERAFLNATAAGIVVVASAGNHGPGEGTVAHNAPWVTTVGASTHRVFQGAVVLGDGERHVGAMISDDRLPAADVVLAADAGSATANDDDARLCRPGSLDAAVAQDRIVVCDRGTVPRTDKSAAVAQAGGAGMVLVNLRPESTYADFHAVPTVHVDLAAGRAIKRYVADAENPRASFDPSASDGTPVPQVAPFSSRGPAPVEGGSLVKPDVTAPGVGVLSAVAPTSNDAPRWDQMSGTSMSAAHVAGLAALLTAEHPAWTPAMVKSAMSTTAEDLVGASGPPAVGAGQVEAAASLDPGLVFDAPPRRFRAWLAGRIPTRNLNLPSIGVGDLTGTARVVRRVTNVSGSSGTFSARVAGLDGFDVRVRPQTLTLGPGESGRFVVHLDRAGAPLEAVGRGSVVWTGLNHQVRMPVVVTPRTLDAPDQATGSGASGSVSFAAVSGTDGRLGLSVTGPAAAAPVGLTLEPGEFAPADPSADEDTARFPVEVPAGSEALRVQLEGRDSDDLDLYLYRGDELVASATGSGADEVVTEVDPAPGEYDVYVTSAVAGNGSTTTAQLYTWVLRDGDTGRLQVDDSVPVEAGQPFEVRLAWTGLDTTSRWFGMVSYEGSDENTFVTLN